MRYTLYQTGPDNNSTYAECWGSTSTSRGREVASSSTLVGLMDAVDKLDHDNWSIYGPGARVICGSRREYYGLPSVAKALQQALKSQS